ncbi:16S rRNA (uracil(1498)-N(3))-methyltransferase [Bacillus sinesaloumensis]|uniref:16S rRNA (uracil(1498)-N(3))-methyltransferase n=1 Tax=Litchfieldia sinesaloumensis TaxID=1926280 RepID=UPI000988559B|nr:16S rRNA (uracil(1498)-N(3))-methyltransferase [Bacillus sinesaloumensis]
MQRYFVNHMSETEATITGEDVHHITRVMRMSVGDSIFCCYNGRVALCAITEITNDTVLANVVEWVENLNELPIKVCIASGLPKGDKLEYVIQKGTELGASEFVPFVAARSIVKWDEKKGRKKVERWEKIAKEAAEQSHRAMVPKVNTPLSFRELVTFSQSFTYKIVAYEEDAKRGESSHLARVLSQLKNGESLFVVIGPEGGLTEKEVTTLSENDFISCSFGPRILRTETAPLYVLSAVSYHFELAR